jgi:hypothetical protein
MTHRLQEFRRWTTVADLVQQESEYALDPTVINEGIDGISLMVVRGDRAYSFTQHGAGTIRLEIWIADTNEFIEARWLKCLFSAPLQVVVDAVINEVLVG